MVCYDSPVDAYLQHIDLLEFDAGFAVCFADVPPVWCRIDLLYCRILFTTDDNVAQMIGALCPGTLYAIQIGCLVRWYQTETSTSVRMVKAQ